MADLIFNRMLGRGTQFVEEINANSPNANAAIIVMVLAASGIESDATLRDKDTFADVVSGTTNEVTNTGYARKTLTDASSVTVTYDDTNDRVDIDMPDQTWTGVAAGDDWSDVVTGIDTDTTGGTDANILPWSLHDFTATPDGSDITAQIPTGGFFRAASAT